MDGAARGEDFSIHDDHDPTFRDGYPELFNTELARPGAVVVDQFLWLDYGVSRDLTVGVNLPATLVARGPALDARYRLYERGPWRSVLSALAIGGRSGSTGMTSTTVGGVVTSTTSYRWSPQDVVTAVAAAGSISLSDAMSGGGLTLTDSGTLQAVAAGLSFSHAVRPWLALELDALDAPVVRGHLDSADGSAAVNLATADWYKRTLVRGVVEVRTGGWLLGGGVIASPGNVVLPTTWPATHATRATTASARCWRDRCSRRWPRSASARRAPMTAARCHARSSRRSLRRPPGWSPLTCRPPMTPCARAPAATASRATTMAASPGRSSRPSSPACPPRRARCCVHA